MPKRSFNERSRASLLACLLAAAAVPAFAAPSLQPTRAGLLRQSFRRARGRHDLPGERRPGARLRAAGAAGDDARQQRLLHPPRRAAHRGAPRGEGVRRAAGESVPRRLRREAGGDQPGAAAQPPAVEQRSAVGASNRHGGGPAHQRLVGLPALAGKDAARARGRRSRRGGARARRAALPRGDLPRLRAAPGAQGHRAAGRLERGARRAAGGDDAHHRRPAGAGNADRRARCRAQRQRSRGGESRHDRGARRTTAAKQSSTRRSSTTSRRPSVQRYKVRRGDNLWSIARRHGISVQAIRRANKVASTRLRPGQVLAIPRALRSSRGTLVAAPPGPDGPAEYQRKRDFRQTPEPSGRTGKKRRKQASPARRFVIQKHAARAPALRLPPRARRRAQELGGAQGARRSTPPTSGWPSRSRTTRSSTATSRASSPRASTAAARCCCGTAAPGSPRATPPRRCARGKLEFTLDGEKLRGRWLLVRTRQRRRPSRSWLLIKRDDEAARPGDGAVTEERPESVDDRPHHRGDRRRRERIWQSRRGAGRRSAPSDAAKPRRTTASSRPARARRRALPRVRRRRSSPRWSPRCRAGDDWLHEIKLDGYRALCRARRRRSARLLTRSGNDWTERFPTHRARAAALPAGAGGAARRRGGRARRRRRAPTSRRCRTRSATGRDERARLLRLRPAAPRRLRPAPRAARRAQGGAARAARGRPAEAAPLRYSDHVEGDGAGVLAPGLRALASRASSPSAPTRPYRAGRGARLAQGQVPRAAGVRDRRLHRARAARAAASARCCSASTRTAKLRYAGKVGTGFDARRCATLLAPRSTPLETATPAVRRPAARREARGVHWVRAGAASPRSRSPSGPTTACCATRRSRACARTSRRGRGGARAPQAAAAGGESDAAKASPRQAKRATGAASGRRSAPSRPARSPLGAQGRRRRGRRRAPHPPRRVLYPEQGLTKLELARYYERVADRILPHVPDRPLDAGALPRRARQASASTRSTSPSACRRAGRPRRRRREERRGARLRRRRRRCRACVALVQMGVLELHPWGSRATTLERPDRLVFDLDPGAGRAVARAWSRPRSTCATLLRRARPRELRQDHRRQGPARRRAARAPARLGRGQGVHARRSSTALARATRRALHRDHGEGARARARSSSTTCATAAARPRSAPYSHARRPGAPVAAPLRWDELGAQADPDRYTVRNIGRRLATLRRDPWEGFLPRSRKCRGRY